MLTAERLREVLDYCPETGVFTRKIALPCIRALIGKVVGSDTGVGYLRISVDGGAYAAHRLAWLYQTGSWPKQHIDHINGIKGDNRFANLRDVSRVVNAQNRRKASSNSKSGLLGVTQQNGRWAAIIYSGPNIHRLGSFDTAEEAHAAYMDAKHRLHKGFALGKAGGT